AGCRIEVSADGRLCLRAIQHSAFAVTIAAHEIFSVFRQLQGSFVVVCGDNETTFQLTVFGREFEDEFAALFAQTPKIARVSDTKPSLELGLGLAVSRMNLSAVSSRCAKADVLRFQHDDVCTRGRKMQRRRQSGVAGPDDADIGLDVALQVGRSDSRPCAFGIVSLRRVASRVLAGQALSWSSRS